MCKEERGLGLLRQSSNIVSKQKVNIQAEKRRASSSCLVPVVCRCAGPTEAKQQNDKQIDLENNSKIKHQLRGSHPFEGPPRTDIILFQNISEPTLPERVSLQVHTNDCGPLLQHKAIVRQNSLPMDLEGHRGCKGF